MRRVVRHRRYNSTCGGAWWRSPYQIMSFPIFEINAIYRGQRTEDKIEDIELPIINNK